MKDFLGNELKVGDEVACIQLGYKNLVRGTVVKLTPQAMRVNWGGKPWQEATLRYSDQVIKI